MSSTPVEVMIENLSNVQAEWKDMIHKLEQNITFVEEVKLLLVVNGANMATFVTGALVTKTESPSAAKSTETQLSTENTGQVVPMTNKIKSLQVGDKPGTLIAKVTKAWPARTVKTKWGEKRVQDLVVQDASAWGIDVSVWEKDVDRFKEGSTLVINNAVVETYKEKMRLQVGKDGAINLL